MSGKVNLILGGVVGNVVEWYDFALYGFSINLLAKLMFPTLPSAEQLKLVVVIFSLGFLLRPIGAMIYGCFGDTSGRRSTLVLGVVLMGASTLLIGLLPTHQPYVIYSPLLLLIFRMIQGLSVGGEFGGSVTFCLEHAPSNRRGFYASIPMAALVVGLLFGALIPTVIFYNVTIAQRDAWAWRIPYLFGGVLAIIGYGMRARMQETPVFCYLLKNNCTCPFPITTSLQFAFREILKVAAIVSFAVVSVIQIYGAIYLAYVHRITHLNAFLFSITGLCIMLVFIVVSGYLSDKVNRKVVLLSAALTAAILSWPLGLMVRTGSPGLLLLVIITISIIEGIYCGMMMAYLAELFPAKIRYTSLALGYNLSFALFAIIMSIVAVVLMNFVHVTLVYSYIVFCAAVVSILGILST